jgi:hypothetical protein
MQRLINFYKNMELCEAVIGYLALGRWLGGDWTNT